MKEESNASENAHIKPDQRAVLDESVMEKTQVEEQLAPGGKAFAFILLLIEVFFLYESIKLFQKYPKFSSIGFFPLVLCVFLILLSIADILENRKQASRNKGKSLLIQAWESIKYLLPKDNVIFILMIFGYMMALYFGVSFLPSSVVFLLASMCFLIRGDVIKNILYTGIIMASIMLVFKVVFLVPLP